MINDRPNRLRRCQLAVPGSSMKMMRKAAASDVDYVFLDLEDSVAPSERKAARANVIEALNSLDFGRSTRCVRINDTTTPFCYGDIVDLVTGAGDHLDTIIVPKVIDRSDVLFVDKLLTQLELDIGLTKRIGIECLIEEAAALTNINEIAASTNRLEALIFGMGDYAASQGMPADAIDGATDYPGDIWHFQRHRVAIACRTYGLDAVDGPFTDFKDTSAYKRECSRAAQLGFNGKWAIHPSQVDIAHSVFSPAAADVDLARRMQSAYDEAKENGQGAIQFEGKMLDAAHMRFVERTLEKARLIGM